MPRADEPNRVCGGHRRSSSAARVFRDGFAFRGNQQRRRSYLAMSYPCTCHFRWRASMSGCLYNLSPHQQQQKDHFAATGEIDAIARADMNAHLGNPFAYGLTVAEVAMFCRPDAVSDATATYPVFQRRQPSVEFIGAVKRPCSSVSDRIPYRNAQQLVNSRDGSFNESRFICARSAGSHRNSPAGRRRCVAVRRQRSVRPRRPCPSCRCGALGRGHWRRWP